MGFFDRIKHSLSRTTQQFVDRFEDVVRRADSPDRRSRPVDVETIEALEEALISADVGVAATDRIVEAVRSHDRRGTSLRDLPSSLSAGGGLVPDQQISIARGARKRLGRVGLEPTTLGLKGEFSSCWKRQSEVGRTFSRWWNW